MLSSPTNTLVASLWCAALVCGATSRPSKSALGTLSFSYEPNITRVTINNPPINLFDYRVANDFLDFLVSIQASPHNVPPKVAIIDSADPDFFIPHVDLAALILPVSNQSLRLVSQVGDISRFLRNTTSTVFIAEVNGRTSGYGNEFVVQTDLRFAGPNARFSQLETSLAAFPGGGGTQALPRLINRGRGLQYLLSGDAVDGSTAKELGWVNESYNDTATLRREVNRIARRIALNPAGGLNATKAALPELYPPQEVYDRESELFSQQVFGPESQALLKKALVLGRNQTRSRWELGIPYTLIELYE